MTTKEYFLDLNKTFDKKMGIFIHHHSPSYNPIINKNNYKQYIDTGLEMVSSLGINNIETPFTHVTTYDNEFVEFMQYLVDKALSLNMTVMIVTNGNLNSLSQEDILTDSEAYLNVMKAFINNNKNRGIIYQGINEAENGTWYGQKNWEGYNSLIDWSNKLYDYVKATDKNSLFVGGLAHPVYFAKKWRDGSIKGDIYAWHPYLNAIGEKGNTTPESQLLKPTFTLGLDGQPFALTEFGISAYTTGQGPEGNWQGMVSAEQAGNYLVRQLIIQDYFNAPMQYVFILGYYYDFKKFNMFDSSGNITPSGISVKNCISELTGYKFDKWVYAGYGDSGLYVAKYNNGSTNKYVYWCEKEMETNITINNIQYTFSNKPQFTTDILEPTLENLIVRTPLGLDTIVEKNGNKEIHQVFPPYFVGYKSNNMYIYYDESNNVKQIGDLIYKKDSDFKNNVSVKNVFGSFSGIYLKSPAGYVFEKNVSDNGSVSYKQV